MGGGPGDTCFLGGLSPQMGPKIFWGEIPPKSTQKNYGGGKYDLFWVILGVLRVVFGHVPPIFTCGAFVGLLGGLYEACGA